MPSQNLNTYMDKLTLAYTLTGAAQSRKPIP